LRWAALLARRGGWLVVDEAFGDTVQAHSVAPCDQPGLIVLRSVGKFSGWPGCGWVSWAQRPPCWMHWPTGSVPGPSAARRSRSAAPLGDRPWQAATLQTLLAEGSACKRCWQHGIRASGTALFQWWPEPEAQAFHEAMARAGIWVRLFTRGAGGIRLGLPPDEAGWSRLQEALNTWSQRG
jgi:cobalamin biosynthetic protein CobC